MRRSTSSPVLVALVLAAPAGAGSAGKETGRTQDHPIGSYLMIDPIYTTIMDGNKIVGLLMIRHRPGRPNAELRAQTERSMPVAAGCLCP